MKLFFQDRHIDAILPAKWQRLMIYVGGERDSIREIYDFIPRGYHLLYLPDLINNLSPDIVSYMFPGQTEVFSTEKFYSHIRKITGLADNEEGILYNAGGESYFHPLGGENDFAGIENDFAEIPDVQCEICEPQRHRIYKIRKSDICASVCCEPSGEYIEEVPVQQDELLDQRAEEILNEWKRIEKKFGVSIDELRKILGYSIKRSKIHISKLGKITLMDYENAPEVKMDLLTKAIYLFYLRHPEGARLKDLQLHEEEILGIYMKITTRDDIEAIRKSLAAHLDPFGNNLNVSVSRIKRAFLNIVDKSIAQLYYITGYSGGVRSITIDRDFVIWEQ